MFRTTCAGAICALLATSAFAGDFTTSGVTYATPDFTAAGGSRDSVNSTSSFFRFPLVDGAEYTVSYEALDGESVSVAVYDFVAPESPTGDPFVYPSSVGSNGLLATDNFTFTPTGSVSFTAATNGTGTIEISDYFGGDTNVRVTLLTNIAPVPVPAAGLLLLGGLGALGVAARRRRAQQA